jgi:ankyrin repeat protein
MTVEQDNLITTALETAALKGHTVVVTMLVTAGADVNNKNNRVSGSTCVTGNSSSP